METIQPLPKALHDALVAAGVTSFELKFQGGSDEGYLEIEIHPVADSTGELHNAIEEWADTAYHYSGAGDGSDYGDDITYDLVNKTASCTDWFMERTTGDTEESKLKVV